MECAIGAAPTFYAFPPFSHVEEVYLFVGRFEVNEEGIARRPRAYWSFNPLGGKNVAGDFVVDEMSSMEIEVLRLAPPSIKMRSWGATWDKAHYDAIRQFHWLCGFNPDSRDVAEFLGLPIIQVCPGVFFNCRNLQKPLLTWFEYPVRPRLKRRRSTLSRIETIHEPGTDKFDGFYDGQPVFEPNPTVLKRGRRKSDAEYVEEKREPDPIYPYEHSG